MKKFAENTVYKNAVAMCVLQIGELANRLSENFRDATEKEIPWKQVKGLRNVVAHEYGKIDEEVLWETVTEDIPALREFCDKQIKNLSKANDKYLR